MPRKRKQTTREKRVKDVTESKESPDALRPEHSAALQQQCKAFGKMFSEGETITRPNGLFICRNGGWEKIGNA